VIVARGQSDNPDIIGYGAEAWIGRNGTPVESYLDAMLDAEGHFTDDQNKAASYSRGARFPVSSINIEPGVIFDTDNQSPVHSYIQVTVTHDGQPPEGDSEMDIHMYVPAGTNIISHEGEPPSQTQVDALTAQVATLTGERDGFKGERDALQAKITAARAAAQADKDADAASEAGKGVLDALA
jgi:outer membrane murein-binding lipoprotein Lpp